MGITTTTALEKDAPAKTHPTAKNRVREIFAPTSKTRRSNRPQTKQPHRKNRPSPTKPASDVLLELYRYSAFGQVETYSPTGNQLSASAIDNPVRWNSRRYDEATQLHYYKYRHYSPKLGRWLGRDPIEDQAFKLFVGSINNSQVLAGILHQTLLQLNSQLYGKLSDGDLGSFSTPLFPNSNSYTFSANGSFSLFDLFGLTPTGEAFKGGYPDYSIGADAVWDMIGGSVGKLLKGSNSCAARVSYTLNKIGEPMPRRPTDYINTVDEGADGLAGNYIVNARRMKGYLAKEWGTDSKCSESEAYYFKSTSSSLKALRDEISAVIKKCKCSGDYVAVVTSLNPPGGRVSGHIGMVTPDYADDYTPMTTDTHVWILPPTNELGAEVEE